MKTVKQRPNLSLKKALLRFSSLRTSDIDERTATDADIYLIEILPRLFIADYNTVKLAEVLKAKEISVVVNLISHKCLNLHTDWFEYENYQLSDNSNEDLSYIVENAVLRIDEHLKLGQGVVVHCYQGISRAPATIIAYLMKVKMMSFEAAFDLVRSKSPKIDPNAGFLMQLNYLI